MGKQSKRKRQKGLQNRPCPSLSQHDPSPSNPSKESVILAKIRHGDPRVRHAALVALSSTVYDSGSLSRRRSAAAGSGADKASSSGIASRASYFVPISAARLRSFVSTAARLSRADSPRERIRAIIDACFSEAQFDEQVFSAWLALYGNARQSARLQGILSIYHRRLKSSLMHELRHLAPLPDALRLAEGIGAMIDGLWLRYALTGKPDQPETPRALTHDYVTAALEQAIQRQRG